MTIVYIILIIVIVLLLVYLFTPQIDHYSTDNDRQVKYMIKFVSEWGDNKKEINYPPNPHTGNMLLVTHNKNYDLFTIGKLASKGISNTAMYGTIDDILDEVRNNPNIHDVKTNPVISTPGQKVLTITADRNNNYLSFSTMLAPSSDFFTGVSHLNLKENGQWLNNKKIQLYPYSAGTDSGNGFNTEHYLRRKPLPIYNKNDKLFYPDGITKPIASLTLVRIE